MGQWNEYLEVLASKAPTPGGGSAAAVYGSVGTALGEMVGNLTTGKKKFAIYEEEIQKILVRLQEARMDFIRLEKADEQAFEPLSEVYRMKAETDEEKKAKEGRMEECLKAAAQVPMEVMERAVSVMDDIEFLALNGSRLAVSDAGVGIQGIRSADGAFICFCKVSANEALFFFIVVIMFSLSFDIVDNCFFRVVSTQTPLVTWLGRCCIFPCKKFRDISVCIFVFLYCDTKIIFHKPDKFAATGCLFLCVFNLVSQLVFPTDFPFSRKCKLRPCQTFLGFAFGVDQAVFISVFFTDDIPFFHQFMA